MARSSIRASCTPASRARSAPCPPRCSPRSRSCLPAWRWSWAAPCATVSVAGAPTEPVSRIDVPEAEAEAPAPTPARWGGRLRPVDGGSVARRGLWWPTLLVAGLACFITFYAKGCGINLESTATTEIALTLLSGALAALAVAFAPRGARVWGAWSLALLLAFTFLTALSVVWSVQPDDSWRDAGRMLAYSGVFGAALALARLAPERWPALLGGLALAAVVICGYALLTKVFPGDLAPTNEFARLEDRSGNWTRMGRTAGWGGFGCIWLGSRRAGHALLSALAYPAMGLLLLTLVLAYSRGALAAFAVGLALWFCVVPLRLRGAAVLIVGGLGAGGVAAWDFSNHALSAEKVPLAERIVAGHQLGALVLAMLVALALVGVGIGFVTARHAPALVLRRRAGATLLALILLAVLAFAGALAHSHRGFTGSISHAVDALTNPNAKPPPNTPDRLTAVASVRARYWKEALEVFESNPALGVGAEGYATAHLRYRHETLNVRHAHGFIVQTLADLGLVGLAFSLALLLAWMAAAGRATHPFNRRWPSWKAWLSLRGGGALPGWRRVGEGDLALYTPERIGGLSMLCLVVVFGAHSLVDWTWYVPGDACVALMCAGWLAGRGPLAAVPGAARIESPSDGDAEHAEPLAARTPFVTGKPGGPRHGDRGRASGRLVAVAAPARRRRPRRSARTARDQPSRGQRGRRGGGRARSALGRSPVHPRGRAEGRRTAQPCACDAPASGAPAALQPPDVAGARALRSEQRSEVGFGGAAGEHLPEPGVDRRGSDHASGRPARSDRNLQRLHTGAACQRQGRGAQKRDRIALARSRRRAPGRPPWRAIWTSSKPRSSISRLSVARL